MSWLAANVPIYAVNVLLSTATDMWALRYPESHELYVLDRRHEKPSDARVSPAHQANSRVVGASVHPVVGGVRQRADGRRPALASARTG